MATLTPSAYHMWPRRHYGDNQWSHEAAVSTSSILNNTESMNIKIWVGFTSCVQSVVSKDMYSKSVDFEEVCWFLELSGYCAVQHVDRCDLCLNFGKCAKRTVDGMEWISTDHINTLHTCLSRHQRKSGLWRWPVVFRLSWVITQFLDVSINRYWKQLHMNTCAAWAERRMNANHSAVFCCDRWTVKGDVDMLRK